MYDSDDYAVAGELPMPSDHRARLSVTPTSAMDTLRSDDMNIPLDAPSAPVPPPRTTTFPVEERRQNKVTTFPVELPGAMFPGGEVFPADEAPPPPPRSLLPMPPKSNTFKPIKVDFRDEDEVPQQRSPKPVEKRIPINIQTNSIPTHGQQSFSNASPSGQQSFGNVSALGQQSFGNASALGQQPFGNASPSGQHSPREIRHHIGVEVPIGSAVTSDQSTENYSPSFTKLSPLDLEEQKILAETEILKRPSPVQFEFRDSGISEQLSPRTRIPFIPPGQFNIKSEKDGSNTVQDAQQYHADSLPTTTTIEPDNLGLLIPNIRMRNAEPYYYQTAPPDRSVLSTIFSEPDEHLHEEDHLEHDRNLSEYPHSEDNTRSEYQHHREELKDDVGELSESTYLRLASQADQLPDFRRASFSSINSALAREEFANALDTLCDTLKQPFRYERSVTPKADQAPNIKRHHIVLTDPALFSTRKMDSDHSPQESPRRRVEQSTEADVPVDPITVESPNSKNKLLESSNPSSIDSSGFEKVDPPDDDVLEAYSQTFAKQMQQSVFGQLADELNPAAEDGEEFARQSGFEVLEMSLTPSASQSFDNQSISTFQSEVVEEEHPVHVLERIPGDIDDPKQPLMSNRHDDVLEKTYGDLIDIPKNEPEPAAKGTEEQIKDAAGSLLDDYADKPVVQEVKDDLSDFLGPSKDELQPAPPQYSHLDDFLNEPPKEQAPSAPVAPVAEEPKAAADLLGSVRDVDEIDEQVENVHEDIDAIMNKMRDNEQWEAEEHPTSPSADSGRDVVGRLIGEEDEEENAPQFGRQTPEESTFDRQGPLTIPEAKNEEPNTEDEFSFVPSPRTHEHHGFETEPRPPTPPKDISDEDVKPSIVDLGPAPPHHHAHKQHSILKHSSSGPWVDFKTVDPRVLDLIYWRDPKKSGVALCLTLLALIVLAKYPLLSVVAYTSLLVLGATLGFRIFKAVESQIKKTEGGNPFQNLLEHELSLPQEKVHEQVDVLVEHGQVLANQTRRLFLVESIVDSVKFGLLLWSLTYISAWFSGFGLLILVVLGVFSIPKVYEVYQEPIDQHLGMIKGHIDNVTNVLEEKLPFLKRAATAEPEKKDQ